MIAPLVLGFATIGLSLFYLAYRYNILFVTETQIDTKGLMYPRALQHLMTGVYISEVCMIGLFGIATSPGPLVLMVIFLVFTVLFHLAMNSALDPLLQNLPKTLEAEEESFVLEIEAGNKASGEPAEKTADKPVDKPNDGEGSPPIQGKKPSIFAKYFHPDIYADFATLRRLVPQHLYDPNSQYTPEIEQNAYYPPSVASTTPLLWVPKDEAGVSAQEVAHTGRVIPITDQGSSLDEKNKLVWDTEATRPPIWEEKVYY
jgi:calcium permeable stress-gated cation channel